MKRLAFLLLGIGLSAMLAVGIADPTVFAGSTWQGNSVSAPSRSQLAPAAPRSISALNTPLLEDFNTLSNAASTTNNVLTLPGWEIFETGGGARDNELYAVGTGSDAVGETFSFGSAGSTDRALGAVRSGTLIPLFGAGFTNDTSAAITGIDIAYTGEHWRLGTAGRVDQIDFQYSTDATSIATGTWIDVNSLDFASPTTTGSAARDGNAAANRLAVAATITGINLLPGASIWIRWTDLDVSGADDGLAIDDFSLTAQGSGPAPTVTSVSPSSGSTAGGYTVSITGTFFTVTPTSITFGGSPCTSITRVTSELVTCVAPSHAAGAVDVAVTTPAGTGTGVGVFTYVTPAPAISVTGGPLAFGNQAVGVTSGAMNLTVTNTGTADLVLGNPSFMNNNQGFAVVGSPNGTVITPGNSTLVGFTFTPDSTGNKSDFVIIDSNAGFSSAVGMTGTGTNPGTLSFFAGNYFGAEEDGSVNITVNRSGGSDGAISADFGAASFTVQKAGIANPATGGASCSTGVDYITPSGTLNWANAESGIKSFNVTLCNDLVIENTEVFTLGLSNVTAGVSVPNPTTQVFVSDGDVPLTRVVDRLDDLVSADECTAAANDCSLRGAIGASNDQDTIEFDPSLFPPPFAPEAAPAAVITLTSEIGIFTDITINGPGASQLEINGDASFRIFGIASGAIVNMSGMTLTNADAGGGSDGGAINQNSGSTLNLNSMVITGNLAARGGGIYTIGATLNVANSTISDNDAVEAQGGGIFSSESTVRITDSIISGNTARYPQPSQGGGGGIFSGTPSGGSLTITGSTISNNCAGTRIAGNVCTAGSRGGGVSATSANISNTVISGNVATAGAGIQHTNGLTLTNSTVSGNTATGSGGGTFGGGFPSLTVIGSTFSANSATVNGGGIYLNAVDVSSIRNSTFSANTAATGGNLWIFTAGVSSVTSSTFSGGTVHNESLGGFQLPVSNSIFASSCTGTGIVNTGFNIDSGTGCGFGSANGSQSGLTAGQILLGPLQNNGGQTETMALLPGSFARNAGSNALLPADSTDMDNDGNTTEPIPFDQRGTGYDRVFNNGTVDIGAFELLAPTAAGVSLSGSVMDANGRAIRGAVITVQGSDGVARTFATNSFGHFQAEGLMAGESYVVSVSARRHSFADAVRVVNMQDSISGFDFRAVP